MARFAPDETPQSVLSDVGRVDWAHLWHLRGAATNVPALLAELASGTSRDERRQALRTLGGIVLPFYDGIDGAVCEVTSYVVPFVARLAAANAPDASDLLALLRRIAVIAWDRPPLAPRPGPRVAAAIWSRAMAQLLSRPGPPRPPEHAVARFAAMATGAAGALMRHFDPVGAEAAYGHRTHEALVASLPRVFRLLGHDDAEVRSEAARLLERLAQSACRPADMALRIVGHLEDQRDEAVVAHLVLALGHIGDRHARPVLDALQGAVDPLVRILAALGTPGHEDALGDASARLDVLVGALVAPASLAERYEHATGRPMTADVNHALLEKRGDAALAQKLLAAIRGTRDPSSAKPLLDVVLELVFDDRPAGSAPLAGATLSRDQQFVLARIYEGPSDPELHARLVAKGLPVDGRTLLAMTRLN